MKTLAMLLSTTLLFFVGSLPASAGWQDREGNPVPDSPSAKSRDGFAAMLVATPDKDWQAKWNTPPETVPYFSGATSVEQGGELHILSFLANPGLDAAGMANVSCDFVVTRPDGSRSIDERDMPCFVTRVTTDPRNVFLTSASLKYIAEPGDPRGEWRVDVTLRDNHRGVELPLEVSFTVE